MLSPDNRIEPTPVGKPNEVDGLNRRSVSLRYGACIQEPHPKQNGDRQFNTHRRPFLTTPTII
jgi:hypothetical protein